VFPTYEGNTVRVLIVSPEQGRLEYLQKTLSQQNLRTHTAFSIADALSQVEEANYSLIILDSHQSDGQGLSLVRQIRTAGHGMPTIMIARTHEPQEEIDALDVGADDVIRFPMPPELLLAKVRSLLRRCEPSESVMLKYEDLQLNLRSLEIRRAGQTIPGTSRELAVLEYLLRHPERVISRTELVDSVWDRDVPPESNVVDVFIARLRRKIDRPFEVSLIHTIVNRGYMLSVTRPGGEVADED
jgi:DNA-binding response OmpR family regulator